MCPILCALSFFLLLFALFFSPSVVLFVGQRQEQMTKLFFVFCLLLIAISEGNSMCVFVCRRKTLKKNAPRKILISSFLHHFHLHPKHFLLKKSHIFFLIDRQALWILNWAFGDRGTQYSERYRNKKQKKNPQMRKHWFIKKKRREIYLDMPWLDK